jgi:hypothetical protein
MMSFALRISVLALTIGSCLAEDLALPRTTVMRSDRSLVSLKAGTVVEILDRGYTTSSIRYKGQTGTIPTSSLAAVASPPVAASLAAKPGFTAAKATPSTPNSLVVDHPQSLYGNLVKKAQASVAKHDDNLVKPANDAMDDPPSK